ncbi:protein Mpv17-like [Ixodes scapularis]|uniref:protein Mpv17-like n=1 Tax=Ixodes scapularis TaxID=6945 RepID=UPI001C38A385|nr:protein Mpv17-like [Ixodes scapularis]
MRRVISFYARLLQSHPIKTQSVTAGTIMLAGDLTAQKLIERKKTIDVHRAAGAVFLGICYSGPFLVAWYAALDRWLVLGSGTSATVKQVILDQLLCTPVYLLGFMGLRGVFQGHQWSKIKEDVKTKYAYVLATSYVIWPAAMAINFRYVPLHYRVVFSGSVAFVWGTCLSYKLNTATPAV